MICELIFGVCCLMFVVFFVYAFRVLVFCSASGCGQSIEKTETSRSVSVSVYAKSADADSQGEIQWQGK